MDHEKSLVADYLAFERKRTSWRQYMKAFGGMAVIVMLGALVGRVDIREAWIVAGLLMSLPVLLAVVEWVHWRRLTQRLERARADAQALRKS